MKVRLMNHIAQEGLARFTQEYEVSEEAKEYDALLVRSASLHEMELPASLIAIARAGAGVNNIPIKRCSEQGIAVFNTPGANANAVKELVVAGLILSGRRIAQGISWVKEQKTEELSKTVEKGKGQFTGPEIAGKKLGVIGLGAIGVQVANAAAALGMDVYGYDPFISVDAAWTLKARIHHIEQLDTLLEECDYLTIHVPYQDKTANMIDARAFAIMKDGVRILNFARGGLMDEDALEAALNSGRVACYVTDFPSARFMTFENVIMLPHLGASTPESENNCACMAVEELRDYLEHGIVRHSVNLPDMQIPQESKNRICIINQNIPDMISSAAAKLSAKGINIEMMANKAKGDIAYTILDTNDEVSKELLEHLRRQEGMLMVRVIRR